MKAILLSGVHGVGKGFFLDKIKKYIQSYNIYSASSLIEKFQPSTDAGYKKVSNVNSNQDVLIKAIEQERNRNIKDFILDGHLCIFNAAGDIVRIPEYFFVETHMNGIILLQDSPCTICDRISQRDSKKIDISAIESMQEEEKKYASELQNRFHIDYALISHECTGEQFLEIIKKIGGDGIE